MDKIFNVAGPCFPDRHYMLPALDRMPEIRRLQQGFLTANYIYLKKRRIKAN